MADAIESFESKLSELDRKLDELRRKRTRIDTQISETEDALRSLRRAVEILNLPISGQKGTASAGGPGSAPGFRPRVLDVLLQLVSPGEVVRVRDLVKRLEAIPGFRLESRTPGSTVSTTLTRAREYFEPVSKGVYRRRQPEATAALSTGGEGETM